MKKFLLTLCLASFLLPLAAEDDLIWSGEKLTEWKVLRNTMQSSFTDGNLQLILTKPDPQLSCKVTFDPRKYDCFSFTYRATGPQFTRGQLYYAHQHTPESITDRQRWLLPAIKNDGQWHTLTVDTRAIVNPNSYFSCGIISNLRFDITDSAEGSIEISEIRFSNTAKSGIETVRWNGKNNFEGWKKTAHLKFEVKNNFLKLYELGNDSSIANDQVNFDPRKYTIFVYTYRARGTSNKTGQLFFAVDGNRVQHSCMWSLPAPIADNKWHTVKVYLQNQRDPVQWLKGGKVTYLRFDPTDGAGGEIEIKDMHFESDPILAQNRAPALQWQLDVPPWPEVKPDFTPLKPSPPAGAYFQGQVIRADDEKTFTRAEIKKNKISFFLRKTFNLQRKPIRAMLQFSGDGLTVASVNNKVSGRNGYWQIPTIDEVSDLLQIGSNTLDFIYQKNNDASGVLADLTMVYADGSFERISSDKSFQSAAVIAGKPDLTNLQGVTCLPPPPHPPWNRLVKYFDFSRSQILMRQQASTQSAVAGEKIKLQFEFLGNMPELPFEAAITLNDGDRELWQETITIKKNSVKKIAKNRWMIDLSYELPLYLSSCQTQLQFSSNNIFLKNSLIKPFPLQITQISSAPGFERPVTSAVTKLPGYGAQLLVNGKPFFPAWGAMQRGKRFDNIADHSRAKLNLVTIYAPSIHWFPRVGKFDPTIFDKTAEIYRRYNPDAYFIWDITMRMPYDFDEKHPDEMCLDDHLEPTRDGGPPNFSFSSEIAYNYFREAMLKAIDYLEKSPYANRIAGYRICGGHTIEWLGWDPEPGRITDFSPAVRPAFERFAREHYPELQDFSIPSLEERQSLDGGELLWDQQKHLKSVAYQDFYSHEIADFLIGLCREAKKFLNNRKIIVSYFGYTMTLGASGAAQMRAHYALKKLLDAQTVDIILSPQPYQLRNIGDTYGDMKPFSTIANHGVMPVIEDDTRTSVAPPGLGYYQTPNLHTTIQVMQRNMAFTLCRNLGGYYYALSAGTEFHYPEFAWDFNAFRSTGEYLLAKQTPRAAEVAVVVSEKSITSMPMLRQPLASGELHQIYNTDGKAVPVRRSGNAVTSASLESNYNKIACAGAPVDYLLAEDLKDHPGDYKMYIFANLYKYDDALLEAIGKLRQKPCTLLWLYAPGYSHNQVTGVENMAKLTGMKFIKNTIPITPAVKLNNGQWIGNRGGRIQPTFAVDDPDAEVLGRYENETAGFAAMKTGNAESIFLGAYQLTADTIRDLYRRAGVHIYSANGDPMEANSALVSLHSRTAGVKTVKLPRPADVLDVFAGRIIARNTDEFTCNTNLHDTKLFYYGNDAEELLKKINRERK